MWLLGNNIESPAATGPPDELLDLGREPVDISFPCGLLDNILVVVVPETTTQLLVVHFGLVFPQAPSSRDFVGVLQLELRALARPGDVGRCQRVVQLVQKKLPQLDVAVWPST